MASMTSEQLKTFISETTIPLIKEHAGKEVADVVKAAVAEALKAQPTRPDYAARLLDDGGRAGTGDEREKGLDFGTFCRAMAAARNDREKAVKAAEMWGYKGVAAKIAAANEKAMSSGDPTAGGFLVPEEFSTDVIELLRATAVVRSLNPMTVQITGGALKIPKLTSGVTASYIGENTNITKSEAQTGQLTLTFKKLAALVPISNDLLRRASPSADSIVRDDAVRSMAQREDQGFIRDDGTSGTPQGLKNSIAGANKFNANSTVSLANVTNDLGKAMRLVMDANIALIPQQGATGVVAGQRPGWIFSPRTWQYLTTVQTSTGQTAFRDEMLRGTLWGYPYRVTTTVQDTNDVSGAGASNESEVYFGAFAHAVIGEALNLIVDASDTAAYHDGSNVIAAFSQDQTVIRVIAEHDFALRHDRAFSLIQAVTWGV